MGKKKRVPIQLLGQAGIRFEFGDTTVYTDPYLSNSVEERDGPAFARQIPIPMPPESITDGDWLLISHAHMDHCDRQTIEPMLAASPKMKVYAPESVRAILRGWNIDLSRIVLAEEKWIRLTDDLRVLTVPAAHPDVSRNPKGLLECVGFVLEYDGRTFYFSGDTSVDQSLIDLLCSEGPIDVAFIPVNEVNFFRNRRGIVGNMSVREAFELSREAQFRSVVPIHWDMFELNGVYPEEILTVFEKSTPEFELLFEPRTV